MFQSNALWPPELRSVSQYGDCISTDEHDDEEGALHVCGMLEDHGMGGEGRVYPLRTWVSPIQQPPIIPE